MESYQKELDLIKTILKENPKGMTVTDIAHKINSNRNSVAKYLDVLLISGNAEMLSFGPAKVYFPSRRMPLSAMLNFVSDYILIIDETCTIIQANTSFLEFFNIERGEIINKKIERTLLVSFIGDPFIQNIKEALEGKECTEEVCLRTEENEFYLSFRVIPTAFDDGKHGATIIFTNITEKKKIETALKGIKKTYRTETNGKKP